MTGAFLCQQLLERVLDVLRSLLQVGLRLVGLAFRLDAVVVGGVAVGFLCLASELLCGVLDFVVDSDNAPTFFRGCRLLNPRYAAPASHF